MKHFKLIICVFIIFSFATEKNNVNAQRALEPEMVFVEGGSFMMGNKEGESDEQPVHEVIIDDFYIGKYEVKSADFQKFVQEEGINQPTMPPWHTPLHPAIYVTWRQARDYCEWLSEKTGKNFRLPTEAEWEYAAKGGQKSKKDYMYAGSNMIDEVCVYSGNAAGGAALVGSKEPNELGIYDMSGNVWEWCYDRYNKNYYKNSPKKNPKGPDSGKWRIVRGGSWDNVAHKTRITYRNSNIPTNGGFVDGFRIVREVKEDK